MLIENTSCFIASLKSSRLRRSLLNTLGFPYKKVTWVDCGDKGRHGMPSILT